MLFPLVARLHVEPVDHHPCPRPGHPARRRACCLCDATSPVRSRIILYLISYDIPKGSETDEKVVLATLERLGATRCLYSEWLLETDQSPKQVADRNFCGLSDKDRVLVIQLASNYAYHNLQNERKSLALMNRA